MITLVLGGNKSGKSSFAEKLVLECNKPVIYIATSVFMDDEMKNKIEIHKSRRPQEWQTIEEGYDLIKIFKNDLEGSCCLIDCVTVYISNLFLKFDDENKVINHIENLLSVLNQKKENIILVSNEIGLSVIQENKLSRRFAELAGIINQMIASESVNVYFCVAGLQMKLK